MNLYIYINIYDSKVKIFILYFLIKKIKINFVLKNKTKRNETKRKNY